jgi:hypothetical protein
MFIVCIRYVAYGVLPWMPFHPVIEDFGDNRPPVRYNEWLLYLLFTSKAFGNESFGKQYSK